MPNPTKRSFLGIAKETTKGTWLTSTDYIPVKTFNPDDRRTPIIDEGVRGSMGKDYGVVQGPVFSEFEFGGDVFVDTIGYPLGGVFGAADFTTGGGTNANTHAIHLKNTGDGQPVSYSITDYDAFNARGYPGIQFSECNFSFNADGLLTYSAKGTGFASAVQTAPTASFSTLAPLPVWTGTVAVAGASLTANMVETGEYNIKRTSVDVINAVDGTQSPYRIWVGPLEITGRMMMVLDDEVEFTRYLDNTQPGLTFTFTRGTGVTQEQILLACSKVAYTEAKIVRGKDYVQLDVNYRGIMNATDIGTSGGGSFAPGKVTLKNSKATGTYA